MDPPRWHRSVTWAAGLSALTTVGLGVLTWGLAMMHAMSYVAIAVVAPDSITAPDLDRYQLAFMLGAIMNLAGALFLVWLAARTPARSWSPLTQGAVAALGALVVSAWVLLHILGIGLIDLVAAF